MSAPEIGPPAPIQPVRQPAADRARVEERRRRRARGEPPPNRPEADEPGHIDTYA